MFTRLISLCLLIIMLLMAACQPVLPVTPEATTIPTAETSADALRTITDASGQEVELPVAPLRVVTLSEQDLDGALALGLTPVGTVNGRGQQTPPLYLGEQIATITSVGNLAEPSLEKIVELQPDLILVGGIFPALEAILPDLRQIAPTVVTYAIDEDWKSAFLGTAEALNREDEANEFLAAYDARVQEIQGELGENADAEVSIVRWNPQGPGIMALDAFASLIVRDLGLVRPATQQIEGYAHSDPLSLEQLDQLEADWLFLGTLNPDGEAAMADAQSSPLYQQLSVVQIDHVVMVDGTVWTSRGGPLAAHIVLDDVEDAFSGE